MRIALVHAYYNASQPSGENVVVDAQARSLREHGHQVEIVARRFRDRGRLSGALRAGADVMLGRGENPLPELSKFGPDVVHVHNLFPVFSDEWIQDAPWPVVATLHNFRYVCAAGTYYRDGHECYECLSRTSLRAVAHKCFKGSRLQTLPLAIADRKGANGNRVIRHAARMISLSPRATILHIRAGVPADRLEYLPNFVRDEGHPSIDASDAAWVYVGRFSAEKGVIELIRDWPPAIPLRLFGAGPLDEEVRRLAAGKASVEVSSSVQRTEVGRILRSARGLVFPSRWVESAVPLSYVEGLAAGLPVLALKGNGAADDLVACDAGVVVDSWRSVAQAIKSIEADWQGFSARARSRYTSQYSETIWLNKTNALYESLLTRAES